MVGRLVSLTVLALVLLLPGAAEATRIFAVTGEAMPRIVSFDSTAPGTLLSSTEIAGGLAPSETVLGMDRRPANGVMYLLTADSGTGRFLRTVDPGSGETGPQVALTADPADTTAPYSGFDPSQGVGFDFNPTSDRVRIATGTDANLRVNPDTGAVTSDDNLNPGTPQVVASAYLNNLPGATATTLYGYDLNGNKFVIQNPPNAGTLTTIGTNSGITAGAASDVGFEIFTTSNGSTSTNTAFLSTNNSLYNVDLTAGTASLVGAVASGSLAIRDIAAAENLIGFTSASVERNEQYGYVQLTLERRNPRGSASVQYATSNGSATAGDDYTDSTGTVSFADGETTKTIAILVRNDQTPEQAEDFAVALSNPASVNGTAVLFGGRAQVLITDNDPDRDGDGVPDATDNCPNVANPAQADANGNGLGTACDPSEPTPLTNATFARRFVQTLKGGRVTSRTKLVPASDRSLAILTVVCRARTACTARYKLLLGKAKTSPVGAAGRMTVPAGEGRAAILRLSRSGLATLRKKGKVSSRLSLRLTDRSGHARTDVVALSLRRR